MYIIIAFFILHWYTSIFTQSFFQHRYAAHGMFSMSPVMEKIFYIISYVTQGSSYLNPRTYGIMHRLHHAHADTDHDPHSPKFHKGIFRTMWSARKVYADIAHGKYQFAEKFKKGLPNWQKFDKFAASWVSRALWGLAYIAVYIIFAPSAWFFLLLPIHFLMSPIHGVLINYFSHKIGYRNFESEDTSTNYLPFDFLTMGEGYHNNHHKHGSRANFGGIRWHELDLTYVVIKRLNKWGLIQMKKLEN